MITVKWRLEGRSKTLSDLYIYAWLMKVEGFDPDQCCLKCLIGKRNRGFGVNTERNQTGEALYNEGDILYFCGVSHDYQLRKNLHVPARVSTNTKPFRVTLYDGLTVLRFMGLEPLPIDPNPARKIVGASNKQIACRNYQFAAQYFG